MSNAKMFTTTALAISLAASILPTLPATVEPAAVERVAHVAPAKTVETVVAPVGQPMKIERASLTADHRPSSLPVFELDGLSMLETPPPIILAGQTGAEVIQEKTAQATATVNRTERHATSDAVPQVQKTEQTDEVTDQSSMGEQIVDEARKYLGIPYVWGGTNPARGLDCSGLVQLEMRNLGISMPRVARQQARVGNQIPSLSAAKPGDLLGMRNGTHIAIYLGDNHILHAPRPGEKVSIRQLTSYDDIDVIRRLG